MMTEPVKTVTCPCCGADAGVTPWTADDGTPCATVECPACGVRLIGNAAVVRWAHGATQEKADD